MNKLYPVALAAVCLALSACTISFQIIDTHGSASDVVDDTQQTDPTVSPNLSIPVSPVK